MKRKIKKEIKELMGILNPISDYRYQYEQHGETYLLYYLDADKEQSVIGENLTAEQMVAVLSVLSEKHACDRPYSWKNIHSYYDKQLSDSGLRIRSMLVNLIHDHTPIVYRSWIQVCPRVGKISHRPYIGKLIWSEEHYQPVAVDAVNGEEYLVDTLYDTDCAKLLQNIVSQRLVEIK